MNKSVIGCISSIEGTLAFTYSFVMRYEPVDQAQLFQVVRKTDAHVVGSSRIASSAYVQYV